MRPQRPALLFGELKREIRRKPLLIPANLFIESLGRHAVEGRELCIQRHLSTTKNDNRTRDARNRSLRRNSAADRERIACTDFTATDTMMAGVLRTSARPT